MKNVIFGIGNLLVMGACNESKSKEVPLNREKDIVKVKVSPISVERGKSLDVRIVIPLR